MGVLIRVSSERNASRINAKKNSGHISKFCEKGEIFAFFPRERNAKMKQNSL